MSTNTDPFAMVQPGSSAQRGLQALGWAITDTSARQDGWDTQDGWDHMEPPTGEPVLVRRSHEDFEPGPKQEAESRITLREVGKAPMDILVVTAEDLDADQLDELREQVDLALVDPDFSIIANFDIDFTVVRMTEADSQADSQTHSEVVRHLWNRGEIGPNAVAAAIQLDALRERLVDGGDVVDGEVLMNRVLLAEERSTTEPCHRCGSPSIDLEAALALGKCEQCRHPWHDGICDCGGWGEDEDRRAAEWHAANNA